jgi:hypothetical protein
VCDECGGHRGVAVAHDAVIACEVEWRVDVAWRLGGRMQAVEAFVVSHVGHGPEGPALGLDGCRIEQQPARPLGHEDAAQGTQHAVEGQAIGRGRDHGVDTRDTLLYVDVLVSLVLLCSRRINLIAEVWQRRNGSSIVFNALGIALTNLRIVQSLPGCGDGRRKIYERAPNSGTASGVQHVKVNVGVFSEGHEIANMLASGDPIAECDENVISLSLL